MSQIIKNVLLGVFALSIIGAGIYSYTKKNKLEASTSERTQLMVINGVITTEKETFFKDPRVNEILAKHGVQVNYERWSATKIAQVKDPKEFGQYSDFAFPNGVQASDKLKQNIKGAQAYNIFYSPMVIATWKPIVDIMATNGLLIKNQQYSALDLDKFFSLTVNKTKWKDLKNSDAYPVNKVALIYTSDSRYSNSSKMFMALSSYVLNKQEVISTPEQADKVIPQIKQMMLSQGNRETSSTNLVTDYTSVGMGKAPMIFIYESEFLEYAFRQGKVDPKMQLIYPSPTIFTKHVLVGFNPKAQKLMEIIHGDEQLKKIAAEYGFRFNGNNDLVKQAANAGVMVPETVFDVIDPPAFDVLEYIVNQVEAK